MVDAVGNSGCWRSIIERLRNSFRGSLIKKSEVIDGWLNNKLLFRGILGVGLLVWIALVVIFDVNRFYGYCAKRTFNDSIGPLAHDGDRMSCRVENESARPTHPGKLGGQIITDWERSRPSWIVIGILNLVTSALNLVLIRNHPKKPNKATDSSNTTEEKISTRRAFDEHLREYWRISWIIFGCTVVVVVYHSITVAMIIDCRDDKVAELFYSLALPLDVLMQGVFILTEVAVRRYLGSNVNPLRKIVLYFIGVSNLFMWGHSIGDSVCRSEVDNAAIVGQQLWSFFDPVFSSAVVFFRVLSGCLYISLAQSSSEQRHDPRTGSMYYLRWSRVDHEEECMQKSRNQRLLDFMMSSQQNVNNTNVEQKIKVYHDSDHTYCYYSVVDDRQQRNTVRSLYGTIIGIPFVAVPFVAYDALARHAGKEQDSHLKYAVEIATNSTLIITLCPLIFYALCSSESYSDFKVKFISYLKGVKTNVKSNVEARVFVIFSTAGVAFYGMLAGVQHGGGLASDILGIFAVVLHAIFIFFTIFSGHHLELFRQGIHKHTRISVLLSLLFAVTLGSLAVDIEREHLDHDVHDKPYLRALAPLIVDFRVHAAILTYNVLSEFLNHQTSRKELENRFEEFPQTKGNRTFCSMPCCHPKKPTNSSKQGEKGKPKGKKVQAEKESVEAKGVKVEADRQTGESGKETVEAERKKGELEDSEKAKAEIENVAGVKDGADSQTGEAERNTGELEERKKAKSEIENLEAEEGVKAEAEKEKAEPEGERVKAGEGEMVEAEKERAKPGRERVGTGKEIVEAKGEKVEAEEREIASWKCTGCNPTHYYCEKCFMGFVIKVGKCPEMLLVDNNDSVV